MNFLTLVLTLPTENATLRMRSWRALKAAGAAALRDGVYMLPDEPRCRDVFAMIVAEVQAAGGTAYLLTVDAGNPPFAVLFDRSDSYAALVADIVAVTDIMSVGDAGDAVKAARKLRKAFAAVVAIDYFPGEARQQAEAALNALEAKIAQVSSPDEPHFIEQAVERRSLGDYQGRIWATRRRPWVDRLASAWLIRRFIDRDATILWLASPADAPRHALGFDYDGAAFTHVGHRVTFETIAESFGVDGDATRRIGGIVHFLDVGGIQPAEAAGLESVLKGMRDAIADDDALLTAASIVFDGLYSAFGGDA